MIQRLEGATSLLTARPLLPGLALQVQDLDHVLAKAMLQLLQFQVVMLMAVPQAWMTSTG